MLGEDLLIPEVARFLAPFPEITVELLLDEQRVDIIEEGYGLAIRIGRLEDSSMIARHLCDYRYVICAAPDYLQRHPPIRHPSDVAQHAAIVNGNLAPSNQWDFLIEGRYERIGLHPKVRVNTDRAVRILILAAQRVGLCLLPGVEAAIVAGRLVRLLRDFEAYDRPVSVIYPHARLLPARTPASGKARAFIDHLFDALERRHDATPG